MYEYHFHQAGMVLYVMSRPPKKRSVTTYAGSAALAMSMLGEMAATKYASTVRGRSRGKGQHKEHGSGWGFERSAWLDQE